MVPLTVAVTVSVPLAVVWAKAADEIIISAATKANSVSFFMVLVPLLNNLLFSKFVPV
jgi:hypothetical protein